MWFFQCPKFFFKRKAMTAFNLRAWQIMFYNSVPCIANNTGSQYCREAINVLIEQSLKITIFF